MKKNVSILLLVLLLLPLFYLYHLRAARPDADPVYARHRSSADTASTVSVTPAPDSEPTPAPTPKPEARDFTISVIGDQTLATNQYKNGTPYSYDARMKGDYSYPFSNTAQYFANDDFTISNLECTLSDNKLQSAEQFYFQSPSAYANILLEGGVDFVTTANNHMMDFGQKGLDDTWATLEQYGIPYGKEDQAQIVTTDSGLKIGVYCAYNKLHPDKDKAVAAVRQLKEDGAEYVICAFHWGVELVYLYEHLNPDQIEVAHACIDAGADLIYGTHTHNLQPLEEYNGGIILYSMGNWSFGGNTAPSDRDTAIVQVQVRRDETGAVTNEGYTIVPCCVSSRPVKESYIGDNYNDYCPTPYTEGSKAYLRALSKLEGTFKPDKEGRDYSDVYASYG
ncbi:MAG: CapA family protein [Oscillospiraceae bacterium]|nr:CapA family protein [Oscillospiraceae bacterium]